MQDWAFIGIPAFRHPCIHACALSRSMLHNQIHTACPCPCWMFMSMLHSMSMLHVNVNVHWHIYRSVRPPVSPVPDWKKLTMPKPVRYRPPVSPVPDWKKLTMPKPVRYRTKLTQSGIYLVRYRTKLRDAGMPMPALVSSMPMPSYDFILPPMGTVVLSDMVTCSSLIDSTQTHAQRFCSK
jgi:hypothetical protein